MGEIRLAVNHVPEVTSGQRDVTVPSIHAKMTSMSTVADGFEPANFNTLIAAQIDWKEPSKNVNPNTLCSTKQSGLIVTYWQPGTEFEPRLVSQARERHKGAPK